MTLLNPRLWVLSMVVVRTDIPIRIPFLISIAVPSVIKLPRKRLSTSTMAMSMVAVAVRTSIGLMQTVMELRIVAKNTITRRPVSYAAIPKSTSTVA